MSREVCNHLVRTDQICPDCEREANHGWHKVSELKPNPGPVLLFVEGEGIRTGAYAQTKFFSAGHQEYPTHWQYLPQPPIH